ncbi:hypothetical protein GBT27_26195 [Escherichia coli]|nr:hypothetical protein [Escherichia coli]
MLPSETMIWQPEFTDKTLSRKPGAVHSMPSCLGTAPRWTAPRILKWHCARPGRRSARTIRRLPGLKLEDWVN